MGSNGIDMAKAALSMFGVPRRLATNLLDAVRGAGHERSVWRSLCKELGESCSTLMPLLDRLEEETARATSSHQAMQPVMEELSSALSAGLAIVEECKSASAWTLFWSRETFKSRFSEVAKRISSCLCNIPLASMVCTAHIQNDVGTIIEKLNSARFELCEKDRARFEEIVEAVRDQGKRTEVHHRESTSMMRLIETNIRNNLDEFRQEALAAISNAQASSETQQQLLMSQIVAHFSNSYAPNKEGPSIRSSPGCGAGADSEPACKKKRVPGYLKCAITLELMTDPVVDRFGHTYERQAILDAVKRSGVSPQTNLPYPDGDPKLVQNYAVKDAIDVYLLERDAPVPETPSIADARPVPVKTEIGRLQALVATLQAGEAERKISVARTLGELVKQNADNITCIVDAGAVLPLVQLVCIGNSKAKDEVVETFRSFTKSANNKTVLAQAGAVEPLVQILRSGNVEEKEYAIILLANLARDHEANQKLIVSAGAVEPLTQLLSTGSEVGTFRAWEILYLLGQEGAATKRRKLNEPE